MYAWSRQRIALVVAGAIVGACKVEPAAMASSARAGGEVCAGVASKDWDSALPTWDAGGFTWGIPGVDCDGGNCQVNPRLARATEAEVCQRLGPPHERHGSEWTYQRIDCEHGERLALEIDRGRVTSARAEAFVTDLDCELSEP